MTRKNLPFSTPDLFALARPLSRELTETPEKPGHLSLMNMVARGAGFRNFQHFRASATAADKLDTPAAAADMAKVAQARRYFVSAALTPPSA